MIRDNHDDDEDTDYDSMMIIVAQVIIIIIISIIFFYFFFNQPPVWNVRAASLIPLFYISSLVLLSPAAISVLKLILLICFSLI